MCSGPLSAPSPGWGIPEAAGGGLGRKSANDREMGECPNPRCPLCPTLESARQPLPCCVVPYCSTCWRRAYLYAYARLGNRHDAEDAVQEAVTKVWLRSVWKSCRDCGSSHCRAWCGTYLCGARGLCRYFFDVLRSVVSEVARSRRRFRSDVTQDGLSTCPTCCTCCGHEKSCCTLKVATKNAVSRLPEHPHRAVMHLRYWCDLNFNEIAWAMREPPSRIRRWYCEGLQMLRCALQGSTQNSDLPIG
jgi:hypothetical protein